MEMKRDKRSFTLIEEETQDLLDNHQ